MRSKEEIAFMIDQARHLGIEAVSIDGVTFHIPVTPTIIATVPEDVDPKEAFKDVMALDNVTDEELLYWATPHYDFLQEQKEAKKQRLAEEKELKNG